MHSSDGLGRAPAIAALVALGALAPFASAAEGDARDCTALTDDARHACSMRETIRAREKLFVAERRELRKDPSRWSEGRERRAAEHRRAISAMWGACVTAPPFRQELGLHAERVARLHRIIDILEDQGDGGTVAWARALLDRETDRHVRTMEALRTQAGMR
jgi:hypothetical protein